MFPKLELPWFELDAEGDASVCTLAKAAGENTCASISTVASAMKSLVFFMFFHSEPRLMIWVLRKMRQKKNSG